MSEQPLVSVLMTAYNRENVIASSIESVLSSTYKNFEFIIVDDCSKDNTYDIVLEYAKKDNRIKAFRNKENVGDYPNRNVAASYASGKYLKYNDSDEELYYFGLQIMVECMEMFPESPLGFCKIHEEKKLPCLVTSEEAYKKHFLEKAFFTNAPSSSMIRRAEFEKVGGFRPIRHRGDYDLWLRMAAIYPVVLLPAFMGWNYFHPGQELSVNFLKKKALNYNISLEALNHPDCPLNEQDKAKAIAKWKFGFARHSIIRNLLKMKISDALYLKKECGFQYGEIVASLWKH